MRVQVLGSGGYFPNECRHTACYFLPESAAALDAGTGAFRLLERLESDELDVFLSHAHLDHIVGLTYLLLPAAQGRLTKIRLFGARRTLDAIREHLFAEAVFPVMPEFVFCPLDEFPEVRLADGGVLTHRPLISHPGGSMAYRIAWPATETEPARSLALVTDTSVDGTYAEFIRGVDLLLHECYFADDDAELAIKTGHSHTTPVATLANEADVGRLVLIHLDPQQAETRAAGLEVARGIFANCEIGCDLAELIV